MADENSAETGSGKGFVHVYTGDGKGKTTAALGLALRAVGAGKKVLMVQFLKSSKPQTSEAKAAAGMKNFSIKSFGRAGFPSGTKLTQKDFRLAKEGFAFAKEAANSGNYDVLILDEINVAADYGLIPFSDVADFIKNRSPELELVLTGRNAHKEIIKNADLVTEMRNVKHYFDKGIKARNGIEF